MLAGSLVSISTCSMVHLRAAYAFLHTCYKTRFPPDQILVNGLCVQPKTGGTACLTGMFLYSKWLYSQVMAAEVLHIAVNAAITTEAVVIAPAPYPVARCSGLFGTAQGAC